MGCNCGGGGSQLGNFVVKDKDGKTVKSYAAVRETEVQAFVAQNKGKEYTYAKS